MFKTKVSLLLIAIFLLNLDFLLSYSALADEAGMVVSHMDSATVFSHASYPQCSVFKTTAINAGIVIIVGALVAGVALAIMGTITAGIVTALAVFAMISAIMTVWAAVGAWVTCVHSFVQHPVIHDNNGNLLDFKFKDEDGTQQGQDTTVVNKEYKECANKNYQTEDEYFKCLEKKPGSGNKEQNAQSIARDILSTETQEANKELDNGGYLWPKNSVRYSEYIRVCHRNPLSFGYIITGGITEEKFSPREKGINNVRTGSMDGKITESPWQLVDGDLKCESLRVGAEPKEIHGTTFKAVQRGNKLCVVLDKVRGVLTNIYPPNVNIGCIQAPPGHIAPMCGKSIAKFKKKGMDGVVTYVNLNEDPYQDVLRKIKEQGYSKDLAEKMKANGYSTQLTGVNYRNVIKNMEQNGYLFDGYDNEPCLKDGPTISKACYDHTASGSLAPMPITSMVVQCIQESLQFLVSGSNNGNEKPTFFVKARNTLKNAVRSALILALVLFSLKIISGGVRSHQEMYMLILKFALVMYFATGNAMSIYYEYLTKFSQGLQDIVLTASSKTSDGTNEICDYPSSEYGEGLAYLASWDKLDCRILFYFGAPLSGTVGKLSTAGTAAGVGLFAIGAAPVVLIVGGIFGGLFAGVQILITITALFMAILMMMVIMWMCYVYILSLFALTVVFIMAPLFIPMVLFHVTKGYFDAWVKELITYSLYPVLLFAFLSFMFISCDKVFFKDLKFEGKTVEVQGKKVRWFELRDKDACKTYEKKHKDEPMPLACALQEYEFRKHSLLGGLITMGTGLGFPGDQQHMAIELMKLALVLFLFYHFLNALPNMAAELAGNHRAALGKGGTPGAMVSTAMSWGKIAAGNVMEAASKLGGHLKDLSNSSGVKNNSQGASRTGAGETTSSSSKSGESVT